MQKELTSVNACGFAVIFPPFLKHGDSSLSKGYLLESCRSRNAVPRLRFFSQVNFMYMFLLCIAIIDLSGNCVTAAWNLR